MLLQWILAVLVLVPLLLFLSVLLPQTQWLILILWVIALASDLYSTHKFYAENPSQFSRNERNKVFILLTKKLGFKKASVAFLAVFEIPLLLFFAFSLLQTLYSYMFHNFPANLSACLAASFGVASASHLQATMTNIRFANKTKVN
jgi:hypothetical protein